MNNVLITCIDSFTAADSDMETGFYRGFLRYSVSKLDRQSKVVVPDFLVAMMHEADISWEELSSRLREVLQPESRFGEVLFSHLPAILLPQQICIKSLDISAGNARELFRRKVIPFSTYPAVGAPFIRNIEKYRAGMVFPIEDSYVPMSSSNFHLIFEEGSPVRQAADYLASGSITLDISEKS